uniref:sn-1-specific diacylglycerol lipase ABHD11 n=1 Tax=Lynceus sp. MCZ IZ 141354 TaxID=1930659 RepID=A0A9N6ZG07_9CRUS|nr:EOG090X07NZ [Lynceus sp. MCZ IZ 141354]
MKLSSSFLRVLTGHSSKSIRSLHCSRVRSLKMAYSSYESTNPEVISSLPPLVIMHGLLGTRSNWNSLAKAIHAQTGRKVITVDARNHGDSPHSDEMNYEVLASDIEELLVDLQIPKATVIGHSMGGRAAMALALSNPSVVDSLIVVDVSPVNISPELRNLHTYFRAMKSFKIDPNLPRSSARKMADQHLEPVVQNFMIRQFLLTNLVEDQGGFKWRVNLDVLEKSLDEIAKFPKYSTKFEEDTLFIGGEKSDYIRYEDHTPIRQLFPKATFTYIAGAGHWVHSEKPYEFLGTVIPFLQAQKARS